jgi:membrane protein DedA with SNARE-associated domain
MCFDEAVQNYGYWAVVVGAMLEGEGVLLSAVLLVFQGYLDLHFVAFAALSGTVAIDHLFFILGRTMGRTFVSSHPSFSRRLDKIENMLERYTNLSIFGFRFMYGLRGLCAFTIGACGIAPLRFTSINSISALVWVALVVACGYWLGSVLPRFFPSITNHLWWVGPGIILSVIAVRRVIHLLKRRY